MPEQVKASDGIAISLFEEGAGEAVILLHGFAANAKLNWVGPGVVRALVESGRRVIAPDARGHGSSGKPHEKEAYAYAQFADDVMRVADACSLERYDLVGYSMGGLISLKVAAVDDRVRRAVFSGIGGNVLIPGVLDRAEMANSLHPNTPEEEMSDLGRMFRAFAQSTGGDLLALAACQSAREEFPPPSEVKAERSLVLVGENDWLAGKAQPLAEAIPRATSRTIGGDHITALADPEFALSIVDFVNAPD